MAVDRFMIGPIDAGLETNAKPWLVSDDAFVKLNNAYIYRGRVRKRFGSFLMNQSVDASVAQLYSRLRVNIDTTSGAGAASGTVPGAAFAIGQQFSIGDAIFTVNALGTPGTLLTTTGATGTFDTTTGAYSFTGADAAADVYFYPALPVMGFTTYESAQVNSEPVFAYDTQFAYQYSSGGWERIASEAVAGDAIWTGNNSQFFWGYTYKGLTSYDYFLFVTNFNGTDNIRYWDDANWNTLNPDFNAAGDTIETARLIVPFKDRLVLLNTVEKISGTNRSFVNRCRFSQNGSPVAADAWLEDTPGKGGYIDAPTKESIITCEFLKDRLIVYFERSTWELAYTGNQILPFVWQQINTELGAESTFSVVPFDKVVLGVGNVGIHACNGANVDRIDQKIPDEVFNVSNDNEGILRVAGIRDYKPEMVYWTFPSKNNDSTYPNRILTYNYKLNTWAFNDDSITAFGYYEKQDDRTWGTSGQTWEESFEAWNNGELNAEYRQVLAGNQEGFVFIVQDDAGRNSPALQITDMSAVSNIVTLTVIDHNLNAEDYVVIENAQGVTGLNTYIFQVYTVTDSNTFTVNIADRDATFSGTYTGGGTIARVSKIDIYTKQYNFYVKQGRNAMINKVDFMLDKTVEGEIAVDYFVSSSDESQIDMAGDNGSLLGSGVVQTYPYALVPLEATQTRVWHPIYTMAQGECIQLRIYFNDDQMLDNNIVWSAFELNAMIFYTSPTSSRLQ